MAGIALLGLIIVTAAAFSFIFAAAQMIPLAALAAGMGAAWIILEIRGVPGLNVAFFLVFVALAILSSLHHAPVLVILGGLSSNLAAWDLSRFRARIAGETDSETVALLEKKHLQKLVPTALAGFLLALLPLLIQLSVSFIPLLAIILLTIVTLRRSVLALRDERSL